jgi:nucleoid DNA-binding protein
MATAKKAKKAAKAAPVKAKARPASKAGKKAAGAKPAAAPMKPIKESFNKSGLVNHLAETAGVEPKSVKAVMAALESTMVASVNRKGAGAFVLPGLLKVTAVAVPAKKARKGINPFTKEETIFKAKPASVKLKVRPLKKLKDAAA